MSSAPSMASETTKPVAPDSTVTPAQQTQENKQDQDGKQDDKKQGEQQK